ncbi:MAG: hypothetical protein HY815_25225 [Candidatus Riflebacteria bacterium]|nr:hypothetical protein [Candidatus Riflebacteria bacterium]
MRDVKCPRCRTRLRLESTFISPVECPRCKERFRPSLDLEETVRIPARRRSRGPGRRTVPLSPDEPDGSAGSDGSA